MRHLLQQSCAAVGLAAALSLIGSVVAPTRLAAFTTTGDSLGLDQRDFRVFNNFTNPEANDNTTPHQNFPGHTGAVMAIWKAHCEWGSLPRGGNGLGDGVSSNPNIGDGGANFDNTFQGLATSSGGTSGNVHSAGPAGGGLLAFTTMPLGGGWSIVYGDTWTWQDGPGSVTSGIDLQGVATHEIGHVLGLGHSSVSGATMTPAISGTAVGQRSIEADDIAGIQFVYGAAAAGKPVIERLTGSTDVGGLLTIDGQNFAATGNEVWFTKVASDGVPSKVTNVSSTGGGTQLSVTIPADADVGEVLVKTPAAGGASLSNAFPADIGSPPGDFVLTGPGVAAGAQNPQLSGDGDLSAGGPGFGLHLTLLPPSAPGAIFVSLFEANLPFKGGVFDPAPILLQVALVSPPSGQLGFTGSMPAAVPSGTGFVTQAWFASGAAVQGFAATNALRLDVP